MTTWIARLSILVGVLLLGACSSTSRVTPPDGASRASSSNLKSSRAVKQAIEDIEAGRFAAAQELLEARTQAEPTDVLAWNALGVSYREQGAFSKAQKAYEKSIALDANAAMAYRNLGILYDLYLHDAVKALTFYEQAADLMPEDELLAKWVVEVKRRADRERAQ